jgi:hypothetical protein
MSPIGVFSTAQKTCVTETFAYAERILGKCLQIEPRGWLAQRYHVRTLANLRNHEVHDSVFAQICRYSSSGDRKGDHLRGFHFYRICLQDHRILDAIQRGGSFIKLVPLLRYIATHELVHILRFERGESDFDMPAQERTVEETKVDAITRSILGPMADREMNLVLDCFGDGYRIGAASD